MVAYQEGNDRAFSVLYNRHSGKLFGYLKNKLKDSHFAEDVFQATFLKLHKNRSRYDPSFPFLPWLFTVCKSVMIDQTRKKSRIREDGDAVALELAEAPQLVESVSLPNLDSLPEMQQKAIELRYAQDLSFQEIAKKLETSPSNVRQLVSRAVKQLKAVVSRGGTDETSN